MFYIRLTIIAILGLIIGFFTTTGIKSQFVRLLDIFIYGPFLIWAGFTQSNYIIVQSVLIFMGSTTITYNLKNYIETQNKSK